MKEIIKKLDKKYLAVFLPLTIIGFMTGGADRVWWWISTLLGATVITWDLLKK